MRICFLTWIALTLWACSGDKAADPYGAACKEGPAEGGCGTPCEGNSSACAAGLYCATDGFCHADCSTEREIECPSEGLVCATNGKCVDFGNDDDDICGNVKITGANVKPNAMLIVDQSGSMNATFEPGLNRWDAVRNLLIGESNSRPSGLMYSLQEQVQFGFATYSAVAANNNSTKDANTVCPMLNNPGGAGNNNNAQSILPFALNNYDTIEAFYDPAVYLDETPTGDAITLVTEQLGDLGSYEDPVIFILATDGEPDRCEVLNPNPTAGAQDEAINAVSAAFALGIKTFVIAIGNEVSSDHAQDVAAAGQGLDPDDVSDELFYRPSNAAALEEDIQAIIRGERPCTFDIDGEIKDMDRVCEGSVRLFTETTPDGRELTCDDPNGWRAVDADTIEIQGQACTDYRTSNSATVEGVFPCGVADGPFVF